MTHTFRPLQSGRLDLALLHAAESRLAGLTRGVP